MSKRRILWLMVAVCALLFDASAATLAEWNFNTPVADADPLTGSLLPSLGSATLSLVGGATSAFGTVGGGTTSDPAVADDSQLRIRTLPRIDAANKSAGIELSLSTIGLHNLTLSWDQYNSRTASRYWRVQYSTDGLSWTDHESIVNTNASKWVTYTVSFKDIATIADQPNLKIRLVQEFESTATGAGADAYAAVDPTATYTTAGSWWIDFISVSDGELPAPNALPFVSPITDLIVLEGEMVDSVPFTIGDAETGADALEITALISNSGIISSLFLNGSGTNRFLSFKAAKVGETEVSVRVADGPEHFSEAKFTVTVVSEPVPPTPNFFLLWNFNSAADDSDSSTGSFEPTIGSGSFNVIGTTNYNLGIVAQGRTSDSAADDNSMLRISSFPRQGENDKSCGIEVKASTAGMRGITLFWDQYNSSSASRYWRIQYTTNGSDFIDFSLSTNSSASIWQRRRSVNFQNVPGAENNPNFAIRLVSEFASDSTYAPVSDASNYSSSGTLWLDMVGFSGESLPDDPPDPPTAPVLVLSRTPELRLSWPTSAREFFLEAKDDLSAEWTRIETAPEQKDGQFQLVVEPNSEARFFRLRENSGP
jgi:hypothetical protein